MTWLLDTLLVTGALIALVLVVRRPVARLFGPGMAYALWTLPLLRVVLPPLVLPAPTNPAGAAVTLVAVDPASAPGVAAGFDWQALLLTLWLAGALAYLGWRAWGYARMRRELLLGARPVGVAGKVRLVESPAAASPIAFGLRDRVVALPPGFMVEADRTARDLAIAHELEHHAGRDLVVNVAVQPLLALHWFNPLAWAGWRALRRDQEAACDARVLAGRNPELRAAYGRMIAAHALRSRPGMAAALACPIAGEKSIVHRLRSLTMSEPSLRRRLLGRALIATAVLALPLTATITYAAGDETRPEARVVKQITIIEHKDGAPADDARLVTRVIERDGKTIVLKTAKPISDAEVEAAVARAEASLPEMPEPPQPPEPPEANSHKVHRRVMIVTGEGSDAAAHASGDGERKDFILRDGGKEGAHTLALGGDGVALACRDGKPAGTIDAEDGTDGKRRIVKLRFCAAGGHETSALAAMRKARERISGDGKLSPELKAKVLEQLDAEIARAGKEG